MKPVSEQLRDYDFIDHGADGILDYYAFVQRKALEVAQLEAALIEIRPKMVEAQEMMTANGFVIDDLGERWQKLAFTLYSYLVEIRAIANKALGGGG